MNAKVPKVASPDLEMPSAELRKEAYELAFSVWEMEPWIDFIEEQVLAIRFADGAERFLSVMGRNGEHRAIALYPDAATYWRIRGSEDGDRAGPCGRLRRCFATFPFVVFTFGDSPRGVCVSASWRCFSCLLAVLVHGAPDEALEESLEVGRRAMPAHLGNCGQLCQRIYG